MMIKSLALAALVGFAAACSESQCPGCTTGMLGGTMCSVDVWMRGTSRSVSMCMARQRLSPVAGAVMCSGVDLCCEHDRTARRLP